MRVEVETTLLDGDGDGETTGKYTYIQTTSASLRGGLKCGEACKATKWGNQTILNRVSTTV